MLINDTAKAPTHPYLLSLPPQNDASSLSDRALLTEFLTYALSREESEQIVERLWQYSDNLSVIIHTDPKELSLLGVPDRALSLFGLLLPIYGRFLRADFPPDTRFDDVETMGRYFACCFCGVHVETVYLLLLRRDKTVIDCRRVAVGSVNSANLNIRALVEAALFAGASHVVVAHNHPSGTVTPSEHDLTTTLSLKNAFTAVGIGFCEHIIVAGNHYIPILLSNEGLFREEDGIII